ncbi:MAG: hypothetical protein B6D77_17075 [gamma proteobacterium symbiont of Ctena orbiculata]|nr:MAG: hypothetical protein B6D77_17075 [gamma proteobacterium symbiont of Ctena orbiculata]PVV22673.1 MAG: hypothetical protein B6D78_04705 [gamma proteobacterium symbiont of Ctena orbiculata]
MDWTKIIWALLLGAMILFLWPRAKHMLKNSPKAEKGDWQAVLMPMAFVIGFVILLIMMV